MLAHLRPVHNAQHFVAHNVGNIVVQAYPSRDWCVPIRYLNLALVRSTEAELYTKVLIPQNPCECRMQLGRDD
jgi:hypothetical protein